MYYESAYLLTLSSQAPFLLRGAAISLSNVLIVPLAYNAHTFWTRMHSSRMRTATRWPYPVYLGRGVCPTHLDANLLDADPTDAGPWMQTPPWMKAPLPGQKEWHLLVKIFPCPKLRLRAVTSTSLQGTDQNQCIFLLSLLSW